MILVIDNYDSFTYNLVQYIGELDCKICVYRNDEKTLEDLKKEHFSHILISPGPGSPDEAGISKDIIKEFAGKIPTLGICLGHQCLGEVFGAIVSRAPYLMHGKISQIFCNENEKIFKGMKNPFSATRYHSLVIDYDSIKDSQLEITAKTSDNIVMGVKHKTLKNVYGLQFHPESILTENGRTMIENFLNL